jgi:hypothetical protein
MGNFLTVHQNAKQLTRSKVKKDLFDFIRTLEKEFAAINRATFFDDSEDVKGRPIGFYSRATELITNGRKRAGEPFDLKETGDFLEGIFAKVQRDSIFFDTQDSKKKEVLFNLLSDDIFGLQDEDLHSFLDRRVQPFITSYFRKKLQL